MLTVLDLFAGIGGFSLGLERTGGFETVAFCECDPHASLILKKHWPHVPVLPDVSTLTKDSLHGRRIDVICGGFPCQDISLAGRGGGLNGSRSGLWFEYLRIIGELRPDWIVIENSPALRRRGLETVLSGLAALGYDAEWHCIPASALGALHRRDRVWVVAYPHGMRKLQRAVGVSDSRLGLGDGREVLAHTHLPRLEIKLPREEGELPPSVGASAWSAEPDVGRVAYGVPSRVDRIKRLGNAVVPAIPEAIGRAILRSLQ